MNVALHGMEQAAGVRYITTGSNAGTARPGSPVVIRYADLSRVRDKSAYADSGVMPICSKSRRSTRRSGRLDRHIRMAVRPLLRPDAPAIQSPAGLASTRVPWPKPSGSRFCPRPHTVTEPSPGTLLRRWLCRTTDARPFVDQGLGSRAGITPE